MDYIALACSEELEYVDTSCASSSVHGGLNCLTC